MRKLLSVLVVLGAVSAFGAAALADCAGHQTVDTQTLTTADVSTPTVPQTPVPPKTEPEG
jgi:hypothetical protein